MSNIFSREPRIIQVEVEGYSVFAERMKAARIKANLSQMQVANSLNRKRVTVTMWELGKSLPALPEFVSFCRLVGTTPNEILGFHDDSIRALIAAPKENSNENN